MPLDTRLPLAVKQFQPITREQAAATGFQLRGAKRAEDTAIQGQKDQQTLRDLYRQYSTDSAALEQGVAQAGLGDQLPAIQKARLENEKTAATTDSSRFELASKRAAAISTGLGSLMTLPKITHQDVYTKLGEMVDAGILTQEQGAKAARGLPGDEATLRPFVLRQLLGAQDAAKQLELQIPKYNEQDRGGSINEGTIDPLTGQRTAGTDIQKTVSPNAQLTADTVANQGAVTYKLDSDGNFIAVPTRPEAGKPITTTSVVDAQGNPVTGKPKNLTEGQSKALLFGSRARDAAAAMDALALKGVAMPSQIKAGVEGIPIVGGALGAAANMTAASPEQQQVEQSQRDFVNAVLRRESGAAIGANEFENAKKQYFPQIGDSAAVIEQKKRNRDLAVQGLLIEVPEAMRNSIGGNQQQPTKPGARPPLDAFFGKPRAK